MRVQYSLVKVLLTVSPARPSFCPQPRHAFADHRFVSPLFSELCELLFSQVLYFDNHLSCPLVFRFFPLLLAQYPLLACITPRSISPFRMNTCKSVPKQRTLSICRMNTYAKTGGGVRS